MVVAICRWLAVAARGVSVKVPAFVLHQILPEPTDGWWSIHCASKI